MNPQKIHVRQEQRVIEHSKSCSAITRKQKTIKSDKTATPLGLFLAPRAHLCVFTAWNQHCSTTTLPFCAKRGLGILLATLASEIEATINICSFEALSVLLFCTIFVRNNTYETVLFTLQLVSLCSLQVDICNQGTFLNGTNVSSCSNLPNL